MQLTVDLDQAQVPIATQRRNSKSTLRSKLQCIHSKLQRTTLWRTAANVTLSSAQLEPCCGLLSSSETTHFTHLSSALSVQLGAGRR